MGKEYESNSIRNALEYLAIFEKKTCLLYEDLTEKMDTPLTKSIMQCISLDSRKHATLLKGIAQTLPKSSKPIDPPKAMKDAWKSIDNFQIDLSKIDSMTTDELGDVCTQLTLIETTLAEEYLELLEYDALQTIYEAINNCHTISFESLKTILLEAHQNEEYHKIMLAVAAELPCVVAKRDNNAPKVRFCNPDAWAGPS